MAAVSAFIRRDSGKGAAARKHARTRRALAAAAGARPWQNLNGDTPAAARCITIYLLLLAPFAFVRDARAWTVKEEWLDSGGARVGVWWAA